MKKRQWDDDSLGRVFGIMDEILYSIALYRQIRPSERSDDIYDPDLRRFWITISNNAVQTAVINWCKVFGAEKNNLTHYANFIDSEQFKTKLNQISFENISNSMRNVRDKFAVHEDKIEERKEIPDLNSAMQVMEAFYETVQEEYDIPELPPVWNTFEAYIFQIQDCLKECRIDWEIADLNET